MGEGYYCKIQEARKVYPRAYFHWKADEDAQLVKAFKSGLKIEDLSKLHKRQPGAIVRRLEQLHLS